MGITPTRIVWKMYGWDVVLDEDGVHIVPGRALEQVELERLLPVINAALQVRESEICPIPVAPSIEEIKELVGEERRARIGEEVADAVKSTLEVLLTPGGITTP